MTSKRPELFNFKPRESPHSAWMWGEPSEGPHEAVQSDPQLE